MILTSNPRSGAHRPVAERSNSERIQANAYLGPCQTNEPQSSNSVKARPLTASALDKEALSGTVILDTRTAVAYARGHVPGSINVGIDGFFATYVGYVIPKSARILLVTDPAREEECVSRLTRLGYERIAGWLEGGMATWIRIGRYPESLSVIRARDLVHLPRTENVGLILDVRSELEFIRDAREGVMHMPLPDLARRIGNVAECPISVICDTGYRSSIAASMLQRMGWKQVRNIIGGWEAADAARREEATLR